MDEPPPSGQSIQSHRDLRVWQTAMDLAEACYLFTRPFPREELFGLTTQIRRAAVSIPANVAEGFGREQTRNFIQSLGVDQGSLKELETHLELAERVGVVESSQAGPLLERCSQLGKMLRSLIRSLQRRAEEQ